MENESKWQCKAFDELSPREIYDLLSLRSKVFVVEQKTAYLDPDGRDKLAHHVFLQENGNMVACARLLPPGVAYPEASIGRVVVESSSRGRGVAHELMKQAVTRCLRLFTVATIRISAQSHLQGFYEQHGFRPITAEYMEDDIPHIGMLFDKSAASVLPSPSETGKVLLEVSYLGHSAWLVITPHRCLLFDYGAQPARHPNGTLSDGVFNADQLPDLPLYVFASHKHGDHYSAYLHSQMAKRPNTSFVMGLDTQPSCADTETAPTGTWLAWPRAEIRLDDMLIICSGSTDSGVSFLVEMPEGVIYHGGDLALWDETTFFRRVYKEEIDWLAQKAAVLDRVPDLAFLPVSTSDGYQETPLLEGLWYFLDHLAPRVIFPMHGHHYESLYSRFAELAAVGGRSRVLVPQKMGDQFEVAI